MSLMRRNNRRRCRSQRCSRFQCSWTQPSYHTQHLEGKQNMSTGCKGESSKASRDGSLQPNKVYGLCKYGHTYTEAVDIRHRQTNCSTIWAWLCNLLIYYLMYQDLSFLPSQHSGLHACPPLSHIMLLPALPDSLIAKAQLQQGTWDAGGGSRLAAQMLHHALHGLLHLQQVRLSMMKKK